MKLLATTLLAACAMAVPAPPAAAATWGNPGDVLVSPDGRHVYAGGTALLTFKRDAKRGRLTDVGQTPLDARQLALSPDGRFLYAAANGVIHILERDASTGKLLHSESITGGVRYGIALGEIQDLAVSPDGAALYVAQRREAAFIALKRSPTTGALERGQAFFADQEALPSSPRISVSPDGRDIYVVGAMLTHFHGDASGQLTRVSSSLERIDGALVARDGRRVYTAAGDGDRSVYGRDAETGALTHLSRYSRPGDACSGCWPTYPLALGPGTTVFSGRGQQGEVQSFDSARDQLALQRTIGAIPDCRRSPRSPRRPTAPSSTRPAATAGRTCRRRCSRRGARSRRSGLAARSHT